MNRLTSNPEGVPLLKEASVVVAIQAKVELKAHDPAFLFNLFCGRMLTELITLQFQFRGIECIPQQEGTFPMLGFYFIFQTNDPFNAPQIVWDVLQRQQLHSLSKIYVWDHPDQPLRCVFPDGDHGEILEGQILQANAAAKEKTKEALKIWGQVAAWEN